MRLIKNLALILGLGVALAFTTIGCGGADGADAGASTAIAALPEALLAGEYRGIGFQGESGSANDAAALWGTLDADGAGLISGSTLMINQNGQVNGPADFGGLQYTVTPAGRMTWAQLNTPLFQGGVSQDGETFAVATTYGPVDPWIMVMGRRAGGQTVSSVQGEYHLVGYFSDHITPADGCIWGSLTLDGMGGGSASTTSNVDGIVGAPVTTATPYTVISGQLGLTFSGQSFFGSVLRGGDVIVLGGSQIAGVPFVVVLMRKTMGTSGMSHMQGTYHMVSLGAPNLGPTKWVSNTATADADGAGSIALNPGVVNGDGNISTYPAFATSYAVASNGLFSFNAGSHMGGVSADGRFAAVVSRVNGSSPSIWVFLR